MGSSKFLLSLFFILFFTKIYSQEKKVAVVTFYADKRVGMKELGLESTADLIKLEEDPNFNMAPLLRNFHDQFFGEYAKSFPFQLVPEPQVLNNEEYKAFIPDGRPTVTNDMRYTAIEGYKVIDYMWGTSNEKNLVKIFNQYDGVMFVFLSFAFETGIAFGGTGTVKVNAFAHIILVDKNGKKVFSIGENARSKKTSAMVKGIPIMKPEKILPMCESALTELISDLQKNIPKIIKKTEAKL
ncbi:MAG: hypothetical protein ACRYFL_00985 [Janthinobacterium lividum]